MGYVAIKRFRHDKERYEIGDAAPKLSAGEKTRLINLGVIELEAREELAPEAEPEAEKKTAAKDKAEKKTAASSAEELPTGVNPQLA